MVNCLKLKNEFGITDGDKNYLFIRCNLSSVVHSNLFAFTSDRKEDVMVNVPFSFLKTLVSVGKFDCIVMVLALPTHVPVAFGKPVLIPNTVPSLLNLNS